MDLITAAITARTDEEIINDYRAACINFRTSNKQEWGPLVAAIEREMKARDMGSDITAILDDLDAAEEAA